jgi:hypothetical protein
MARRKASARPISDEPRISANVRLVSMVAA